MKIQTAVFTLVCFASSAFAMENSREVINIAQAKSEIQALFGDGFKGKNVYGKCSLKIDYLDHQIVFTIKAPIGSTVITKSRSVGTPGNPGDPIGKVTYSDGFDTYYNTFLGQPGEEADTFASVHIRKFASSVLVVIDWGREGDRIDCEMAK